MLAFAQRRKKKARNLLKRSLRSANAKWVSGRGFILLLLLSIPPLAAQESGTSAQEEKKFVLYHTTGIDDTQQILDRFRKRYPHLQVENHRLSSPKMIQ